MPLFAYGTLMFSAIIESVIGRLPESRPAVIKGYRRLEVAGESFPGLVEDNDATVEGVLYWNISEPEWDQLTAFEGEFYELEEVAVFSAGRKACALAFVVPPSRRSLLSDKVWNPDFFRENHLPRYSGQRKPGEKGKE
jgi:gamma-glutamylcyclotransferase (GGCT)/AIG2-like uncharacterized protein YtfP